MSRSSSSRRSYKSDRESGSFCTTVEDLLETSISHDANESKIKETMKTDSDERRSPNEHKRHKSSSRRHISRSPSRSPSSSRSRRSSRAMRSSRSRRSSRPALRIRSTNRRHTTHNNSGMTNQQRVISEEHNLQQEGNEIELKSLNLKAEDELSNRPKNGEIYDDVSANLRSIKKRLKHLSKNHRTFSIDEAIEVSDAAFLLKLLRKPENEIELAGQMAHKGALLMLQAKMLKEKGLELLDQSKHKLRMAEF